MKNLDEIRFEEKKRQQAGMTVPDGFFQQFQQQLETKIDALEAVKPVAPVVEMSRRSTISHVMRWSVAACCALVLGVGAFFVLSESTTSDGTTPTAAAESVDVQTEESEMEDMIIRSVNDFEMYDYYCEL